MPTFWLSTHVGYACRHSGVCCTSRWPIPIERDRAVAVRAAIQADRVIAPASWLRAVPDAPADVSGLLALTPAGACVFHRDASTSSGGGCAIYGDRPAACQHFPYACVVDPRGVHVTLSHYCPTAARMLFECQEPVRVVEGPPIFADGRVPEGLDAREALPPEAAPRPARGPRLMSWPEVTAWERDYIDRLAADRRLPGPPALEVYEAACAAAPAEWGWPNAPPSLLSGWTRWVAPAWAGWAAVIGRYLAAKAHASWALHLGSGPRDVERSVAVARTVLQVEAVRRCTMRQATLDRDLLFESLRQSDLLLLHHADPRALVFAARGA